MVTKRKIHPLIAITGLGNAGKTTLVHRLKTGEFKDDISPTIGFQVDIIRKESYRFDLVDLGGQIAYRNTFWENFVTSCHGCIFIFDRSDKERLSIAKEWLWKVDEWLPKGANFAFFANKSDLESAMPLEEVVQGLALSKFSDSPSKSFRIFETSNVTGQNINECWDWITNAIRKRMESKTSLDIYAFELLDERLEPIISEILIENEKKEFLEETMGAFNTHSLKMIDSLPFINIGDFVVHIIRKGDYYAITYIDKDDSQNLARELSLTLMFETLYRIRRDLKVDKDFLLNSIETIEFI